MIYFQIGNTPRDGYYGACFLQLPNKTNITDAKVYCARPGSRLWEADVEGHVLQTMQYKIAAQSIPHLSSIFNRSNILKQQLMLTSKRTHPPIIDQKKLPQLLQKLQPIFGKYIFSYTKTGFYIFNPSNSDIILWNDDFRDIQSIKIVNGTTLLIFTSQRELFSVSCRSLEDGFIDMLNEQQYDDCMALLILNKKYFKEYCVTQGYVSHILKLKGILSSEEKLSDDFKNVFNEFMQLVDQDEPLAAIEPIVTILGKQPENSIYIVENGYSSNFKSRNSTGGGGERGGGVGACTESEDNIKSVLLSASRNILNKFNIFNEPENILPIVDRRPIIIPYQNIDDINTSDSDEIVAPIFNRNRKSLTGNRGGSIVTQAGNIIVHKQLSAEDKLLQNLFMIYKSSRMSNLSLVERYGTIFDKYDCCAIRLLLQKLADIMQKNGIIEAVARLHCYEMYFNYLNPDLIWEFDDESRQFIIDGFVAVNNSEEAEYCSECQFPVIMRPDYTCKYKEIGTTIFKYFWSRSQQQRCYDLAFLVPWTIELICKFLLQTESDVLQNGQKINRLLFACGHQEQLQKAIDHEWFSIEMWEQLFEMMILLNENGKIICSNCDNCSMLSDIMPMIKSKHYYTWSFFLNCLVNKVRGRKSIELLKKYSSQITCDDAIPKDFYLVCLLKP